MNTVNELFERIELIENPSRVSISAITSLIQERLNLVYSDWRVLRTGIQKLESNEVEYSLEEDGLYTWIRLAELSDIPERERPYFENYIESEGGGIHVNWENECLMQWCGDDYYSIQDDSRDRRDRGVWQGQKLIIPETEYIDEETSEVNETLRNQLIEKHMESEGCYPGVFRVDYYGNVTPVNTTTPREEEK